MLRNSTKLTSLVVAAATVASMTPAFAADYSKLDSKDGIINTAIAYKDGKFLISGEVEDKDEAAYYLADGKYTDLDDSDVSTSDAEDAETYGSKYVKFDTDLFLDLETGKVTDDEVQDDDQDGAKSAIKRAIKKDDPSGRYTSRDYEDNLPKVDEVNGNKFSGLYYETSYDGYKVYSDAKGNYIDADHLLGKVSINGENYKNISDLADDYSGAKIIHDRTLAQDKDYVYREATLVFGNTTGDEVKLANKNITTDASLKVIQKISKAVSSDDKDDAQLPKTVKTYFLTAKDDTNDKGAEKDLDSYSKFTVVGGKIVGYEYKDEILSVQAFELSDKSGYGYVDKKDGVTNEEDVDAVDTDVDGNVWYIQNGYIKKYDLDDDADKMFKIDGNCDSLSVYDKDNLIVWSSDEDDEVYSIVAGKAAEDTTAADTTTTAQAGWVQNADSTWSYINADGTKAIGWLQSPASGLWYYMDANGIMETNKWIQDGGKWFFVTESGAMKTGWLYNGGAWYYLNTISGQKGGLGCMQTGWILTGGKWYYCNASGAMLANTTVNGYVLGADGAWIK